MMPRFFFNLHDRDDVVDEEGLVLDDVEAARQKAIAAARDIMAEDVKHGVLPLRDSIGIEDENGATVLEVPFKVAVRIET